MKIKSSKSFLVMRVPFAFATLLVACGTETDNDNYEQQETPWVEDVCNSDSHCTWQKQELGCFASCEAGYVWADASDFENLECIPETEQLNCEFNASAQGTDATGEYENACNIGFSSSSGASDSMCSDGSTWFISCQYDGIHGAKHCVCERNGWSVAEFVVEDDCPGLGGDTDAFIANCESEIPMTKHHRDEKPVSGC